jgi:ribose transport system ATP-binding protein
MTDLTKRETVLTLTDVVKTFPGVRALDGVQLEVRAGEVHCLLGQNGAGKSTLIKVLSGAHRPDSGEVVWLGQPVSFTNPQAAMRAGIATIYQELDLVDGLSVADNIFLAHEPRTLGFVNRPQVRRQASEILASLGHPEIPVRREVGKLPAAAKQVVSMGRALSREAKLRPHHGGEPRREDHAHDGTREPDDRPEHRVRVPATARRRARATGFPATAPRGRAHPAR